MFAIRQAKIEDIPALLKLARMVQFINLPADRDIIYTKVVRSRESLRRAAGAEGVGGGGRAGETGGAADNGKLGGQSTKSTDVFMFVLEDLETGECLGTSQIIPRMGGPGNPNFSLRLSRREFFSHSLQTGTSHMVARLYADETGPTEIGGLILQPGARGGGLGRLLSLVRFHFIGLHRELFSDRLIAEMMAPATLDGQNMLWEYLGRRFIPLSYQEADKHCQRSREFISALLPREDIYLSLLPPEARDVIGRVSEETEPARRMLERLGFVHRDLIDPFDGGPHLEAVTDNVPIVRETAPRPLGPPVAAGACTHRGFVSLLGEDGGFRAVEAPMCVERGEVSLTREVMDGLRWEPGARVGVTPMQAAKKGAAGSRRPAVRTLRKARGKKARP